MRRSRFSISSGLEFDLHPDPARGLVHQVDRFVGKEAVGDVAVAERRRCNDRSVGDPDAVVELVLLLEAAQDRDRIGHRRFADEHRLEAPLERRILLDIFAIFVERRRSDAVKLTAAQRWFQEVAGVHRALGLPGADDGVNLVDEEDDVAFGLADLVEYALQPFLELAPIFRTCDERAHVERQKALVLDAVRDIAIGDPEREAFGDGGLADARLTDQHRIVLRPAGKHLDRAADFLVTADDRVELPLARRLGEVARIFLQRVIAVFRALCVRGAAAAQILDGGIQISAA